MQLQCNSRTCKRDCEVARGLDLNKHHSTIRVSASKHFTVCGRTCARNYTRVNLARRIVERDYRVPVYRHRCMRLSKRLRPAPLRLRFKPTPLGRVGTHHSPSRVRIAAEPLNLARRRAICRLLRSRIERTKYATMLLVDRGKERVATSPLHPPPCFAHSCHDDFNVHVCS